MKNPVISQNPYSGLYVYAWGAAPYIKRALKINGEISVSCTAPDGKFHILSHGPHLRPQYKIFWPLSIFSAHDVQHRIAESNDLNAKSIQRRIYTKWQIGKATEKFLEGLPSDAKIFILVY